MPVMWCTMAELTLASGLRLQQLNDGDCFPEETLAVFAITGRTLPKKCLSAICCKLHPIQEGNVVSKLEEGVYKTPSHTNDAK